MKQAEEASRPLPEKNFLSLNASPWGPIKVADWSKVSMANLPASGGIAGTPEDSRSRAEANTRRKLAEAFGRWDQAEQGA